MSDHASAFTTLATLLATPASQAPIDAAEQIDAALGVLIATTPRDTVAIDAGELGKVNMPARRALRVLLGQPVKGVTRTSILKSYKG